MKHLLPFVVGAALIVGACQSSSGDQAASPEPSPTPSPGAKPEPAPKPEPTDAATGFAAVQPILLKNCVLCHTGPDAKEEIDLNTYASVMKGGEHGAIVVPGDPEGSMIVKVIRGAEGAKKMPPAPNEPLTEPEIQLIVDWIKAGAKES